MKNGKTLIIFDFDNTLFKTREFWREKLFPFYIKIGIPRGSIEKAFIRATRIRADYFIPRFFIDELYRIIKNKKNYTKTQLMDILEKIVYFYPIDKEYFYPYSLKFLNKARKKYQMLLISYGDKNFKTKFFKHCHLDKYFSRKEIIITNKAKIESFKGWIMADSCIAIDNIEAEIKEFGAFFRKKGIAFQGFLFNNKKAVIKKEDNITVCKSLDEVFRKI